MARLGKWLAGSLVLLLGMAAGYWSLRNGESTALEALHSILGEELTLRESRRIDMSLRTARLMPPKTLDSYDFSFQPSLDRERIEALASLEFMKRNEAVHFLGPPGTGKSHLACALGIAAVKAGKRVYRTTLAELVDSLTTAERNGRLNAKMSFYTRIALLIVDEIGYLPVSPGCASLFFQLVSARYEKGATLLTSNRGFAEWCELFGDPVVAAALLDKLLHHATVIRIEGASYRLREHANLLPEHVRINSEIRPPAPTKKHRKPTTAEDHKIVKG